MEGSKNEPSKETNDMNEETKTPTQPTTPPAPQQPKPEPARKTGREFEEDRRKANQPPLGERHGS
jgi:hypothetical protein